MQLGLIMAGGVEVRNLLFKRGELFLDELSALLILQTVEIRGLNVGNFSHCF